MGNSYLLTCPEDGETALRAAVARVDREMCGIRDAGRIKARERIAVLAALNLAYTLTGGNGNGKSAEHEHAATSPTLPADAISALIQKLDVALDDDGKLI